MLVLTINAPEKVRIGDEITIQFIPRPDNEILKVKRVDTLIDAPNEVVIVRSELLEKIKKDNHESI